MPDNPRKLHRIDTIRVVAEYLVVRVHVRPDDWLESNHRARAHRGGHHLLPFRVEMMYTFERVDFSTLTWKAGLGFYWYILSKIHPLFLFNWLCWIPYMIKL
jgi:hypothetical protein